VGSLRTRVRKTTPAQAHHSPTAEQARHDTGTSEDGRSPRTMASSPVGVRGDVGLPGEVERLLLDVVADGFVLYCCGPRDAPRALVASYYWEGYLDLLTIRRFDRIITARIPDPQDDRVDVFAPEVVVWAYEGPPQPALRALLGLLPPHHPHAPTHPYPAPPALLVPPAEQRPMTIQLPTPGRAGHRAARLTARITGRRKRLT
jgi:hypothetical protein